jgi:membrane-bound lytic murein transglycosylase B
VIFSVAKYLHEHGYNTSYRGRKRGIHRYNPLDSYVNGVITYADAIMNK